MKSPRPAIIRMLVSVVEWGTWRAGLALATSRKDRGIVVSVIANRAAERDAFAQVIEALALLERYDARRLAILRRRVSRVLVTENDGSAYVPTLNACLLSLRLVQQHDPAKIAVTIVHEMTHARLWRLGYRYTLAERERIERICVAEEMRFAQRLPGGAELQAKSQKLLESRWWDSKTYGTVRRADDGTISGRDA